MSKTEFVFSKKHFRIWYLLAFLSGSVNAGGYLACQRFVSHVTGFATLFGVDVAYRHWFDALGILSVPLYYLGGAMVSAFLVERRLHLGKRPYYALTMVLVMSAVGMAALGGELGWFGEFGETLRLKRDYLLLALLCTASGLQNAVVSSLSGSIIRTTHLTGTTTDLGIGLIRVLYSTGDPQRLAKERQFNYLRGGTIAGFILGSAGGATAFAHFGYMGFLLPTSIAAYVALFAWVVWEHPVRGAHVHSIPERGRGVAQ